MYSLEHFKFLNAKHFMKLSVDCFNQIFRVSQLTNLTAFPVYILLAEL